MSTEIINLVMLVIELGGVAVLLMLSALFSSSETSFFSLTRSQLEEMRQSKDASYDLIRRMLNEPRRLIITILIGNELVNITISVIMASMVIRLFGAENSFLNLLIVTPLLLIFGEITPKTLAMKNNLGFAKFEAPLIQRFAQLTTPIRESVRFVADGIITMIIGKQRSGSSLVTEDMVLSLTSEAVGDGVLQKNEAHYIRQIFKFGETKVEEVMTPRSNVQFLAIEATPETVITQIKESSYSKFPVYKEDQDHIVGVFFSRDLIQGMAKIKGKKGLKAILRDPYFVPETRQVIDLFHHFRSNRISMALVLDEYGGITGLVTMDDLLRCIFGDLPSVSGEKQAAKRKSSKFPQTVDATIPVTEFNRLFNSQLPTTICNTINGLVLHYHGELPKKGTQVQINNFIFTVVSMTGNRVNQITFALNENKNNKKKKSSLFSITNKPTTIKPENKSKQSKTNTEKKNTLPDNITPKRKKTPTKKVNSNKQSSKQSSNTSIEITDAKPAKNNTKANDNKLTNRRKTKAKSISKY